VEDELSLEARVWLDDVSDSSVGGGERGVVGESGRERSCDEGGKGDLHDGVNQSSESLISILSSY
jgi:hypothetical protein